jgi:hypothetical protein
MKAKTSFIIQAKDMQGANRTSGKDEVVVSVKKEI